MKKFLIAIILLFTLGLGFYFYSNNQNQNSSKNSDEIETISITEISAHNTKDNCWTTINGSVYDLTNFISKHKGGDRILAACGKDATDLFTGKSPMGRVHSQVAVKLLEGMKIGNLQK